MSEKFSMGDITVELDRRNLEFDKANINQFLAEYAGNLDYYHGLHAYAQQEWENRRAKYNATHAEKFIVFKTGGKSDKLAEAMADMDQEIQELQKAMFAAQYRSRRLYGWLDAMDAAYTSAKEFCWNLRKEMDKLYGDSVRQLDAVMSRRDQIGQG